MGNLSSLVDSLSFFDGQLVLVRRQLVFCWWAARPVCSLTLDGQLVLVYGQLGGVMRQTGVACMPSLIIAKLTKPPSGQLFSQVP